MPTNLHNMLVDFRESRSQVPKFLERLSVNFKIANLAADYIVGEDCFVERKTVEDFISSLSDGRLFKQIWYLTVHCKNPVLLLEGGGLYSKNRVPANIIRGTILWITVTKKVALIRTFNEYDTACTLRLLAKKYSSNISVDIQNKLAPYQRKNLSNRQRQTNILTQIPGIGKHTANLLINSFGSLGNLLQQPDSELKKIHGMGNQRLKYIRQTFFKDPQKIIN